MTMTPSLQKLYEAAMPAMQGRNPEATAAQRPQTNDQERTMSNDIAKVTIDVPRERLEAFRAFYRDFFEKRGPYDQKAERAQQEQADTVERGIASLRELYQVAQRDSGQCHYIARFLAGLYNGWRFPFDLTDFRCLDRALFEHCINVLRLDYRPEQEVHQYFDDGGAKWEDMIRRWGLTNEQSERARQLVDYADGK